MTLIRIHRKGQMTLPSRLRSAIGITEGDLVEATVHRGKIVLTPKLVVDRSNFPTLTMSTLRRNGGSSMRAWTSPRRI